MNRSLILFSWLMAVLLLTFLFNVALFGWHFVRGNFYFGNKEMTIDVPPFGALLATTATALFIITALIIIVSKRFWKGLFPIVILGGLFCVITLEMFSSVFYLFRTSGWTIYPPLSSLAEIETPFALSLEEAKVFIRFLQINVIVLMFAVVYRWGFFNGKKNDSKTV
ncbi:MAG: hypothetical protein WBP58_15755 [Chitinophagaceae bacterium]